MPRSWRAALAARPRDVTDLKGVATLFARGFSEALSLGAWRTDHLLPDVPLHVIAEIHLANSGNAAWPQGAFLCPALPADMRGNGSDVVESVSLLCAGEDGDFSPTCPELTSRGSVRLV